ncbi:redoxin domain-containing protein [Spongiimicrobium salis]|uniref:redoxin domain-containing protein n=1 Tax=Spongiimicrobium salis TaxID=1667022 RepID=UPI00374D7617
MALQNLIKNYNEFEKKEIEILVIFASPIEEIFKYAGKQVPPFSIISDPKYKIYKYYGVEISYKGMLKTMFNVNKVLRAIRGGFFNIKSTFQAPVLPADFLIDENLKIKKAHYGKTYDDHLSISEVLNWNVDSKPIKDAIISPISM